MVQSNRREDEPRVGEGSRRAYVIAITAAILVLGAFLLVNRSGGQPDPPTPMQVPDSSVAASTVPAGSLPAWAASVLSAADRLEITSSLGTTVNASYNGAVDVIVEDIEDRFEGVRSFQMRERHLLTVPWDESSVVEVLFTPTDESTWDVEARLVPLQGE